MLCFLQVDHVEVSQRNLTNTMSSTTQSKIRHTGEKVAMHDSMQMDHFGVSMRTLDNIAEYQSVTEQTEKHRTKGSNALLVAGGPS